MSRFSTVIVAALVGFFAIANGCGRPAKPVATDSKNEGHLHPHDKQSLEDEESHTHGTGSHGGLIVSLGRDSYHVEAIVTDKGEVLLYMLGSDETRVIEIEAQKMSGFVKAADDAESVPLEIVPQPQAGDNEGKSSLFVARLPSSLIGKSITITVPSITIGEERFRLGFTTKPKQEAHEGAMPKKATDDAEKSLYLTPGGIYTEADIEANGKLTASQKFANFESRHDLKPKPGDKICPITLTKANSKCTWIVGGKTYEFCCPPCVDEFVSLAKTKPEEVKPPETFIKE